MSDIQPLNYALPPPLHRRRIFRRWIYVVVLLSVVASGWWWVPPAWQRVEILYWQHRCMVYSPPANQIIFDSDHKTSVIAHDWSEFYSLLSPPGFRSEGTIFLHELRLSNGTPRLVAVDVVPLWLGYSRRTPMPRTFAPGSFFAAPIEKVDSDVDELPDSRRGPFAVFAGNIDPKDPSHFSFRTMQGQDERIYDGYLMANENVIISQRKPAPRSK